MGRLGRRWIQASGLLRNEFEDGILPSNIGEHLQPRTSGNREISLHGQPVATQVLPENFRFIGLIQCPELKSLTTSPTLQPHFSAHAGISHPLRLASWGHEEPIALIVEYILVSSRRAPTFGLSPGEGSCGAGQCPRDKVTEQTIGKPLNRTGLRESRAVHTSHDQPNRSKLYRANESAGSVDFGLVRH